MDEFGLMRPYFPHTRVFLMDYTVVILLNFENPSKNVGVIFLLAQKSVGTFLSVPIFTDLRQSIKVQNQKSLNGS